MTKAIIGSYDAKKINYINDFRVGGIVDRIFRDYGEFKCSILLKSNIGKTILGDDHFILVEIITEGKDVFNYSKEITDGDYILVRGSIIGFPEIDEFCCRTADRCVVRLKNVKQILKHIHFTSRKAKGLSDD